LLLLFAHEGKGGRGRKGGPSTDPPLVPDGKIAARKKEGGGGERAQNKQTLLLLKIDPNGLPYSFSLCIVCTKGEGEKGREESQACRSASKTEVPIILPLPSEKREEGRGGGGEKKTGSLNLPPYTFLSLRWKSAQEREKKEKKKRKGPEKSRQSPDSTTEAISYNSRIFHRRGKKRGKRGGNYQRLLRSRKLPVTAHLFFPQITPTREEERKKRKKTRRTDLSDFPLPIGVLPLPQPLPLLSFRHKGRKGREKRGCVILKFLAYFFARFEEGKKKGGPQIPYSIHQILLPASSQGGGGKRRGDETRSPTFTSYNS